MAQLTTGNGLPDVVVTGFAMTTALATDAENTWKKLLDGQSGIRKLEDPFVEEYDLPVRIGGHLLEDFESELNKVELRRMSYLQRMATVVGRRAWQNAGAPEVDTRRLMVSVGTGMGSSEELLFAYDDMRTKGLRAVSPLVVQKFMPNGAAAVIGLERGAKAGVSTAISACASGSEAIANAWRNIVYGEADMAICGGVETKIEAVPIAGFAQMRIVLSTTNDDPAGACRPFDARPQRLRVRRSRGVDGDRDRGARQSPRRQHHRPHHGRLGHLRRLPHRGARPQRRTGRPGHHPRGPTGRVCSPATSTTSTPTRPAPRWATSPRARPSTTRWVATGRRSTRPSRRWATRWVRSARWSRS